MNKVSDNKMITAIIYHQSDAIRFLKERPAVTRILALTPDARAVLLDVGIPVLSTLDVYTDYSHLRVLGRIRRWERDFQNVLKQEKGLGLAAKETLRANVYLSIACAARLWETLKETGPWLIPVSEQWITTDKQMEAHILLLEKIAKYNPRPMMIAKQPLAVLVQWINQCVAKMLANRPSLLLTNYGYGMESVAEKITSMKSPLYTFTIQNTTGNWKDIAIPLWTLWKAIRKSNTGVLIVVPQILSQTVSRVEKILGSITDPILQCGINDFQQFIIHEAVVVDGLKQDLKKIITIMDPKHIWANYLKWDSDAALAEVGRHCNVETLLISHGTHTPMDSACASYAYREQVEGVLVSPLADATLVQSPHAEAAAKQFAPSLKRIRSHPIMWGYRKIYDCPPNDGKRLILHTGTYKYWYGTKPWIFETGDEFVKGLNSLVVATKQLENTKLIIRVRPMFGCSISTLEKLLPESDHYEIKTSGTFLEDLGKADVLVSWASTTIEEALHARKPVLLWGGSMRYYHLTPRKTYPTAEDRSAVYAPETEDDLAPLLASILNVHAGRPLTNSELHGHIWPPNIPDVPELIDQLNETGLINSS